MKLITYSLIIFAALCCGCASPRVSEFSPPQGFIVTSYTAPVCLNQDATPAMKKAGSSSSHYIYDFILTGLSGAWGDTSIAGANESTQSIPVGAADYRFLSVLGIYKNTKVTVYSQ